MHIDRPTLSTIKVMAPPIFFHFAGQQVGPITVEHVAQGVAGMREKSDFDDTGFILERINIDKGA